MGLPVHKTSEHHPTGFPGQVYAKHMGGKAAGLLPERRK